eukprot:PhF_6_TR19415/c0_g1_i1/m.28399
MFQWSTALFDVTADPLIFLYGILCPWYLCARTKAGVEGRRVHITDFICCPSDFSNRQQIRSRYGVIRNGSEIVWDSIVCVMCFPCALCQNGREVRIRAETL